MSSYAEKLATSLHPVIPEENLEEKVDCDCDWEWGRGVASDSP